MADQKIFHKIIPAVLWVKHWRVLHTFVLGLRRAIPLITLVPFPSCKLTNDCKMYGRLIYMRQSWPVSQSNKVHWPALRIHYILLSAWAVTISWPEFYLFRHIFPDITKHGVSKVTMFWQVCFPNFETVTIHVCAKEVSREGAVAKKRHCAGKEKQKRLLRKLICV